jgi:hypothetical protein
MTDEIIVRASSEEVGLDQFYLNAEWFMNRALQKPIP